MLRFVVEILLLLGFVCNVHGSDWTDPKSLAKAKWERDRTSLSELLMARRDSLRKVVQAGGREFFAGKGTQLFLLDAVERFREAELALCEADADRLGVLEKVWQVAWQIERTDFQRFEEGRIPGKDWEEAKYLRAGAEIALAHAWSLPGAQPSRGPFLGHAWKEVWESDTGGMLSSKELARAKLAAVRANRRTLSQVRLDSARNSFGSREAVYVAGNGTQEFVVVAANRLRDAELAVATTQADRWAAFERYWLTMHTNHLMEKDRFNTGRIPEADYQVGRYFLLGAQIDLIQARRQRKVNDAFTLPTLSSQTFEMGIFEDFSAKDMARAECETLQSDPRVLLRDRREAVQIAYREREKETMKGKGTLAFTLADARRLQESDLALDVDDVRRLAHLERYWERLARIEGIMRWRFDQGRVPVQDWEECRIQRLDAEIRLIPFRKGMPTK